jgi:hypothetical protein
MSEFQRLTLGIQVSRDANHVVPFLPLVTLEFDSEPDYSRWNEIHMIQGPSSVATIDETEFTQSGQIDDVIIYHKTSAATLETGLRVQFTNMNGAATSDYIPPGKWAKYSGCNSDITLTNSDPDTQIEVLYFCSGADGGED